MKKRSAIFVLLLAGIFTGPLFAADQIQITSYYPAPYGSYRDLETKKSLAVGNISTSGIGTVGALAQGEVWVEDSVIFRGRDADPAVDPNKEGEVIYNSLDNVLKYSDGATWRRVKSQCYVSYTGSCLAGYNNAGTVGNWGYCQRAGEYIFFPPEKSCSDFPGYSPAPASYPSGTAIICCQ